MRRAACFIALVVAAQSCPAWEFTSAIEVSRHQGKNTFHHLDATGRRSIAVNDEWVAVSWEDNHSGETNAYVALKRLTDDRFLNAEQLNTAGSAYTPGITAFADGFVAGWSDDDAVWARFIGADSKGSPVRVSTSHADQIALAPLDSTSAIAVWMSRENGTCIYAARLQLKGTALTAGTPTPVSDCAVQRSQSQPAVATGSDGTVIVWQDRTTGTNRVYASRTKDAATFTEPVQINETVKKSATWGAGSSAINPSIEHGAQGFWVSWLDKRADRAGYKVYSALSEDGLSWSENLKVQDDFGDETPQWSVSLAVSPTGDGIATWSDAREAAGQDIYFARTEDGDWSENHLFEGGAGPGDQGSPSVAVDAKGTLHIVWIDKADENSSALKYATGTADEP